MIHFPNLREVARHMDQSGGYRFPSTAAIEVAVVHVIAKLGRGPVERAEDELLKFCSDHAFGTVWAAQGQDDEGEPAPLSDETNAVLEAVYGEA